MFLKQKITSTVYFTRKIKPQPSSYNLRYNEVSSRGIMKTHNLGKLRKLRGGYLIGMSILLLCLSFQNCGKPSFEAKPADQLELMDLASSGSSGSMLSSLGPDDKINIGHAGYMSSTLTQLFVNPTLATTSTSAIKSKINGLVTLQIASMGGPCSRYDDNCSGGDRATAPVVPLSNAIRKGYLIRSCEEILSIDEAVTTALTQINLTPNSAASDMSLSNTLNLFFPGRAISEDVLAALKAQHEAALNFGQTPMDAWRFVFLSLCTSPLMEML